MTLLKHFWPLIKIFQVLGEFPFTRDESGIYQSRSLKFAISHYILIVLIIYSFWTFALQTFGLNQFTLLASYAKTNFDFILLNVSYLSINFMNVFIITNIIKEKEQISHLLNNDIPKSRLSNKLTIHGYIISFSFVTAIFILSACYNMHIVFEPDVNLSKIIILGISLSIYIPWVNGTGIIIIILINDLTNYLSDWSDNITDSIENQNIPSSNALLQTIKLYKHGLNKVNSTFNFSFFVMITFSVLILLSESYSAISTFFSQDDYRTIEIILSANMVFYALQITYTIIILCFQSQKIIDKIGILKEKLVEIPEDEHTEFITEHGKSVRFSRNDALQFLEKFQGYDCLSYFHLGKSLFAQITATFVTYMIILIQFKIGGD